MNIHPNTTPASPSLASPLPDTVYDSIELLTTSFAASVAPTLETTTVTEVALGYHRKPTVRCDKNFLLVKHHG